MDALDFIQDRYDMSYDDIEKLADSMAAMPFIDFNNIIDLMESYAEYKESEKIAELKQNHDEFTIKFAYWFRKEDTQENAEKYFHFSDNDMLNAFKEENEKT